MTVRVAASKVAGASENQVRDERGQFADKGAS